MVGLVGQGSMGQTLREFMGGMNGDEGKKVEREEV